MKRVLVCVLLLLVGGVVFSQEWTETEIGDMSVRYAVSDGDLLLSVTAPTRGWAAIGFEPTRAMRDANILIGYVDDDSGEVVVEDDFGNTMFTHVPDENLGGESNVTVTGGNQTRDSTTIEFSIPLDSGDQYDQPLVVGTTVHIILAWGANDNIRVKHRRHYSGTIDL